MDSIIYLWVFDPVLQNISIYFATQQMSRMIRSTSYNWRVAADGEGGPRFVLIIESIHTFPRSNIWYNYHDDSILRSAPSCSKQDAFYLLRNYLRIQMRGLFYPRRCFQCFQKQSHSDFLLLVFLFIIVVLGYLQEWNRFTMLQNVLSLTGTIFSHYESKLLLSLFHWCEGFLRIWDLF